MQDDIDPTTYEFGTVSNAIREAAAVLREADIPDPMRDARLLASVALNCDPSRITLLAQETIYLSQWEDLNDLVQRRVGREPISHILGGREFYGRWFRVNSHVLDPRPETETLVAEALKKPFEQVLDLGTGSGAILVTLLAENLGATGIGTDKSERALEVAEENARSLGVADRVGFLHSDWFDQVGGCFDLIVSNPPYIAVEEMASLAPELSREPRMALTDENDGLTAYRRIAAKVAEHLVPGGRLLVEIGWKQGQAVAEIFQAAGLEGIAVLPDLDGRDRVVGAFAPQ